MKSLPIVAILLGTVSAHTIMQAVGGYSQGVGIYMPSDDSPQTNVGSNSMACNGSPVGGFSSPNKKITMQAGQTYTGAWLHTLTSTGPDSTADNKVIDSSHKGPVMAYMKKVSDSLSGNPSSGPGDGWFKIAQDGYDGSKWGVDSLISAGGVQSFTIPSCIVNGDYLVRLEVLALHSAYDTGGAQFYMECISVTVTGGSGTASPSTVSIPGAYSVASDPSIKLMIYNDQGQPYPTTSYTPPGTQSNHFQLSKYKYSLLRQA
ncbi:hypothetical protein V494_08100 [Pseudogymnoascus sp. VKM F-4513 (FW-928)]|nr:hypothetical protein V494_08100 [Pseudogymnoascus sp. VKM F-4513 (FW-928)]